MANSPMQATPGRSNTVAVARRPGVTASTRPLDARAEATPRSRHARPRLSVVLESRTHHDLAFINAERRRGEPKYGPEGRRPEELDFESRGDERKWRSFSGRPVAGIGLPEDGCRAVAVE